MGQAPPGSDCNFDGRGTPFVKAGEFGERRPIIREWTTKPVKFAKSTDVLVCVVGATCGKLNLGADCAIGRSVAAIRSNPALLNQGFLYAFLRGWTLRLRSGSQGSAQGVITREMLASIPMPLPPLTEQERIVKLLDEADELRKLRAQADRHTSDLIPALFNEMFGDPEHTPFTVKPLIESVVDDRPITYGILKPGPDIKDGIPYVRVLDIKQSRLHVEQLHKTTKEIAAQYRRSMLRPGDILVTIRGTVGRTCIVPDELTGANITQDTARLAIVPRIEPIYVVEFLNTPWAQGWMNHRMQGQAVKGINLGDLKKLPVPLPPLPLQKEFAARVSEIRAMQAEQAVSRRRLDDLFQSMLHRAFQGEL
jgi:type I restriction enzyme S subunit